MQEIVFMQPRENDQQHAQVRWTWRPHRTYPWRLSPVLRQLLWIPLMMMILTIHGDSDQQILAPVANFERAA